MIQKLLYFLGFMTKSQALVNEFTHYGSYYGIPIWIKYDKDGLLEICEKHIFFVPFTFLFFGLEVLVNSFKDDFFDNELGHMFIEHGKIEDE